MQNKFGMFIHWGFYSLFGVQEQVFARNDMPREEYESAMYRFNPTEYDPEKWVLLAKEAGMKYICFTTKHHDGFCMWDTKYTDYNIMNTPYGKDVLRMLADACHKHGLGLSLYYSNPDWNHENGNNPLSTHQWKAKPYQPDNHEKYGEFVKNQVRELLTNYGPIFAFFWDIPPRYYDPSFNELVRELQPGIIINNRGRDEGDFRTPEREVPDGERFDIMAEACQSVGEQSWGYRPNEDYYSARFLMSSVDKVMAMGGSYVLNVGPDATGVIPEKSAELIRKVGSWYTKLGGVLEGNEADTRSYQINAYDPYITNRKDGKTYFHFYKGISTSAINFFDGTPVPKSARLLNSGEALGIRFETLPDAMVFETGKAGGPFASIFGINGDDYPLEPIVIEVEW